MPKLELGHDKIVWSDPNKFGLAQNDFGPSKYRRSGHSMFDLIQLCSISDFTGPIQYRADTVDGS